MRRQRGGSPLASNSDVGVEVSLLKVLDVVLGEIAAHSLSDDHLMSRVHFNLRSVGLNVSPILDHDANVRVSVKLRCAAGFGLPSGSLAT